MTTCSCCRREVRVGDDCYQVCKGVLGTRDFINLESDTFCSRECLEETTGKPGEARKSKARPLKRRIP